MTVTGYWLTGCGRAELKTDLNYDEWNKDVAPDTELRKWFHANSDQFPEFERRYREELESRPQSWQPLGQSGAG